MSSRLAFKIAIKYIFNIKSLHFITIISLLSIIGIIVGIAAIISVLSIFNGFREFTQNQFLSFDPHIRIIGNENINTKESNKIINSIKDIKEINSYTECLEGKAIISKTNNMQVFNILGINQIEYQNINNLDKFVIYGQFLLKNEDNNNFAVIGSGLANKLRLLPGDTIKVFTPNILEKSIKEFNYDFYQELIISGIFQSNNKEYDDNICFIDFDLSKEIFSKNNNYTFFIDIKLYDFNKSFEIKSQILEKLNNSYKLMTWFELHKDLFNIMKLERIGTFSVLSLIIMIAVFNILASLTMTVIEKQRDISILISLGASPNLIKRIFLFQGFIIGIISSSVGTILGLVLTIGQIHFKWFKMDTAKYLIDAIPVKLEITDVILAFSLSLILSIASSIFPAKQAIKISFINSIRYE